MKGITPIIAILVLLLITVAIAGAAWVYITSFVGGMTRQQIEVTSSDCSTTGTTIYIRNIGTEPMNISSDVSYVREVVVDGTVVHVGALAETFTPGNGNVGPSQAGTYRDANCNTSTDAVCKYTIIAAGRVAKVQVTC